MAISDIKKIRLLPPLAIARLGSSPQPMDNYDLEDPADITGFRKLVPAPTMEIVDNKIARLIKPAKVQFRDQENRIRPVSPFLEIWAIFDDQDDFEPLTKTHLSELGLSPDDVRWRVNVGNLKAYRRTGDENDKIIADTGFFSDHVRHTLSGKCKNFKPNKNIPFGTVQYIEQTDDFPELRLRFVPASGKVYGPNSSDPNLADDVYDRGRGGWDDHMDGAPGTPEPTTPAQIFRGHVNSQSGEYISDGYLDDACDGIVECSITVNGKTLNSFARISSGPPDFAPDSYPVRTVADELEQIVLGPRVLGAVEPEDVKGILRRALETVRLINTAVMNGNQDVGNVNRNNMAGQDTGSGRALEPIFNPALTDATTVRAFHAGALTRLAAGTPPNFLDIVRKYDEVGNLTDNGRHKMPAMMRGSDGQHLALTRRQRDTIRAASEASPSVGGTPEEDMASLISFFQNRALLHSGIDAGDGKKLSDLFTNPAVLMNYLISSNAKGSLAGAQAGQHLIVPGNPDASAFMQLIRRPGHPMQEPFSREIPGTGRTGAQIVERWIRSIRA